MKYLSERAHLLKRIPYFTLNKFTSSFYFKSLYQARNVSRHVYVLDIYSYPVSTIFLLDFATVQTVW